MKISKKTSSIKDYQILLQDYGYIGLFGLKLKTLEAFMMFRVSICIAAVMLFLVSGLIAGKNFVFYGAAIALLLYFIPAELLKGKISRKSKEILASLPDVIDMMASLINAGLTLDESLAYISENLNNPVSRLFKIYHLKIFEGSSRKEAFDTICRMSFCTEFKSFIKIIQQSEIIGNPVKEVLRDLSRVYRNNQRDFLKMRAEKLESNLIIVIFIFIFIPMLMIFLIPVIPQLMVLF